MAVIFAEGFDQYSGQLPELGTRIPAGFPQDDELSMHQGDFGTADLSLWYGDQEYIPSAPELINFDWREEGF